MFTYRISSLAMVCLAFISTGCLDTISNPLASSGGGNTNSASPSVSNVALANNSFTIVGSNLSQVQSLQISGGGQTTALKISNQSSTLIQATAVAPIALILGTAYNLLVSTANAQTVSTIPITVQIANNSLNPSVLTSGGAIIGQILQWSGTSWGPVTLPNSGGGTGGGSSATGPFLYVNGVNIGKVLSAPALSLPYYIQIWDSTDGLLVTYIGGGSSGTWTTDQQIDLWYQTTNCSDNPHAGLGPPGTGVSTAGTFYQLGPQSDTITPVAYRWEEYGILQPCQTTAARNTVTIPRASVVASPSVPISFNQTTMQILNQ